MVLLSVVAWGSMQNPNLVTPYFSRTPLAIKSVIPSIQKTVRFEPVELKIDMTGTYDNPFDPADIDIRFDVRGGTTPPFTVHGFFTADAERKLADGKEQITLTKPGYWAGRISFPSSGNFEVTVTAKDRTGTVISQPVAISVEDGTNSGFVQVSKADPRYFETSTGEAYYPIGNNICWGGDAGTFNYDKWLANYAAQGLNEFRLWLSPHWTTFATEVPGKASDGRGLGQFALDNLWRLDYVLALAKKHGMRVKLCFDSYNMLRDRDAYPSWEDGVWNAGNGGILRSPLEFWQSPSMDRYYQNKLRYLVARYAADPTVVAWEFWNEVDLVRDFPADLVKAWHQRMGRELRKLDVYDHLITTSFSDPMGTKEIDMLQEIDFIQTHNYNSPDVISQVAVQQSRKGNWGKPHLVGEIGADGAGPRAIDDPTGIQIHDPLWISIAMGSTGSAQPWWWDNYIEPKNLYGLFGAAKRFVTGIDWPREAFRQTRPEVGYGVRPVPLPRADLTLSAAQPSWEPGISNTPTQLSLSSKGASGNARTPGILHGMVSHANLHNPVTFKCDFERPTPLDVLVTGVSGYGGAKLKVEINGSVWLQRDFADPDGNTKTETLSQYNGAYTVMVPAGKHTVTVTNNGTDWLTANFRFRELTPRETPALIGWAVVGDTTALAWLRVEDRSWTKLAVLKENPAPVPACRVRLDGLASGKYRLELWDTWKGEPFRITTAAVGLDGTLEFGIPPVETDVAI
ncbi:MAG TPA: hypothetical protein VK171_15740, partial [Fimbriimonas sp.]|nr:hypothetical protein [Fimbriimonas sp.]